MTKSDVQNTIIQAFKNVGVTHFRFLQAQKGNGLSVASNLSVDGNAAIVLAGSGCLYFQEESSMCSVDLTTNLPVAASTSSEVSRKFKKSMPLHFCCLNTTLLQL